MRTEVDRPLKQARVAPLVPLAMAVAAGIVADRFGGAWETTTWAALAGGSAVTAFLLRRWRWLGAVALVLAWVALGGGWHHRRWSDLPADDLARSVDERPRPAWLRGVLVDGASFRPGLRPESTGSTRTVLVVAAISDGQRWRRASGRVLATIAGDRTDLKAGEVVSAAGTLAAVAGPLNPGEFDYRDYLRAQGIRLRLSIDGPEGIRRDPGTSTAGWSVFWPRVLGAMRAWSHDRLVARLDARVAPLAAALLLGQREEVDPDINDAFARTGTTHLLAISGLQLQVLAVALLAVFQFVGLGRKRSFLLVAAATAGYALLVGLVPSVVRSAAMTVTACVACMFDRRPRPANTWALAALVTLGLNPAHLFDVGCQLSFLAVAAIAWGVGPAGAWSRFAFYVLTFRGPAPDSPLDALERRLAPWWQKRTWEMIGIVSSGFTLSVVVWLVALPLTTLRFHLVTPIGILLNIFLVPMTSLALLAAGLTLIASALWPPLAMAPAWLCASLLRWTEGMVRWGSTQAWGHAFVPGPSWSWVLAFYAGLALATWASLAHWPTRRGIGWALGFWGVLGIGASLGPKRLERPEAEFLAVGHGLAIIVQGTDGQVVLFDCGRLSDPSVGRRLIAPALWERGVRRIETLILSHADMDHINGLPDLLDRFAIGSVKVAPGFAHRDNPRAARLLDDARARGMPIETTAAGDRWSLGGLTFTVLHPPSGWHLEAPDNDRSIVLDVEASGRHLLLTGDLAGAGLAALMAQPSRSVDAIQAPHHGGRTANPPQLYRWARPGVVVVSQRRPRSSPRDPWETIVAPDALILRTWQRGAIRLRWNRAGLDARGFLDGKSGRTSYAWTMIASYWPAWARGALAVVGFIVGLVLVAGLAVLEWGAWTLVRPGRKFRPGVGPGGSFDTTAWETIETKAPDGVRLVGFWRSSAVAKAPTALLLHGFAEESHAMLGRAEALARRGWNVAVPDSRGRGLSGGHHLSFGGREADDLRTWLDALVPRIGPESPIVAWGRSMGAAVALRAASDEPRIAALVLEAPYTDLTLAVAAWLTALRVPRFLARPMLLRAGRLAGVALDRPRPIDLAPKVRVPTLIICGTDDPITPPIIARLLADAFPQKAEWIEVAGAHHTDVFDRGGPELAERIAAFLEKALQR
jgi:competence protein ComEC